MSITIPVIVTIIHITVLSTVAFIIVLIIPFGGFFASVSAFAYAYFPIPVIAIWSSVFGERRRIAGSILGLFIGLLGSYALLTFMTLEKIEMIGDTKIVRHAGPTLNQAADFKSYIFPIIVMIAAIKLYWYILAKEAKLRNIKK